MNRCSWPGSDPVYITYHDQEWGVPEHDDLILYEKLMLDGFQAGLSWITILKKRCNFRDAFDYFNPYEIVHYDETKIQSLMMNTGIVRNKKKIDGVIDSARAYLSILELGQTFSDFIWQFTDGQTIKNTFKSSADIPKYTRESIAMSKALNENGFKFCGPTICYAFMQATGMVNDHIMSCFRYNKVGLEQSLAEKQVKG